MSIQEAALYGDLVLALRDYAAEQLVAHKDETQPEQDQTGDVEAARAQLDEFIRTWFFTPQDELYGSAPREVIWREQLGEPNFIPKKYAAEAFDDDCPLCQAMRQEIESAESDEAHGHHWTYCPDSCLLDLYDPEGSDERWSKELAWMEEEEDTEFMKFMSPPEPDYDPPLPPLPQEVDPETFLSVLRRPWLDPELHKAAQQLAERCDVPLPPTPGGNPYRRVTRDEAASLIAGLHQQGVDIQELLAQIKSWPYQNIALDWLSEPERNATLICQAMETEIAPEDEAGLIRFRNHRNFILHLAQLVPPGARLWLSGWLEAVTLGAMLASPF